MKEIQMRELLRALKLFEAFDCKFKVITPNGEEFGVLEVVSPKSKAVREYPYGEMRDWYKSQLNLDPKIGEVQEIRPTKYPIEKVRSGICSLLSETWGQGAYKTTIVEDTIQIMRIFTPGENHD